MKLIEKYINFVGEKISYLIPIMVLLMIIVIVSRYFFGIGRTDLQELVMYFHALVFLGCAGYVMNMDAHVRVDIFYRNASNKYKNRIKHIKQRKKVIKQLDKYFYNFKVCEKCTSFLKYNFKKLLDKEAIITTECKIGQGTQILKGSIIGPNVSIGNNCIINTKCVIEHDVIIGNNCHIAPGSIILGGAKIGDNVFIGANSVIIQNL